MKAFVFILLQERFQDNNFGDLVTAPAKIIGVFATEKLALKAQERVPERVFKGQFHTFTAKTAITKQEVICH